MVHVEHIALECDSVEHAKMIYEDVFQCSFVRSFDLSEDFSEQVFSIKKAVSAFVYQAKSGIFEVFVTGVTTVTSGFGHVCISVPNMAEFFTQCEKNGLKPYTVNKNEKSYVFVRDMVGNLFEVKSRS